MPAQVDREHAAAGRGEVAADRLHGGRTGRAGEPVRDHAADVPDAGVPVQTVQQRRRPRSSDRWAAVRARPVLCQGSDGQRRPGLSGRQLETTRGCARMDLTLLTAARQPTTEVLPALGLLSHRVTVLPLDASALVDRPLGDVILVDGRRDLAVARGFTRVLAAMGTTVPTIAVLTEGGLIALSAEWTVDDIVLDTAGPAELDARLRLVVERRGAQGDQTSRPCRHRRPHDRRDELHGAAVRRGARPHLQGVRAAEVPRPASRPRLHPLAPRPGGVGLRLLRRHPHGGRPRTAAAREARPGARRDDRHGAQRGLQVRTPGCRADAGPRARASVDAH